MLYGLLLICAVSLLFTLRDKPTPAHVKPQVITASTNRPGETPPAKNYTWIGNAEDPKRIIIPAIGVNGFIQQVGVDQHTQVAVPNNIHMAGWFINSSRPGQPGLSIIDGHVDGRTESGIFKNLRQLKTNDEITVERGDGQTRSYRVMSVQTVATADAAGVLFSQDPTLASQLNLITCGGTFSRADQAYDKRVVVTARPL